MFRWDKEIEGNYVLCGTCALSRNALTYERGEHVEVFTKNKQFDGMCLAVITYYYNPNIDFDNFVTPMSTNPNLLLPNAERAIIEALKFPDTTMEITIIESLNSYIDRFKDTKKLYEMAEFYKYPKEQLEYWINEALNDTEI